MDHFAPAETLEHVTCPACGLLCDDLGIERTTDGRIRVTGQGCPRSIRFFERPQSPASPRIAGNPASLEQAIAAASEILRHSRLPLIGGLGTEVQGMRAVMSLADRTGATLDHMNSNGFMRNLSVVQNSGWQTCSLTEVRNRVDLLVVIGTDIVSLFPRFFERVIWNRESMFGQDTAAREVVYLGGRDIDTRAGIAPDGRQPEVLPCDPERLPEVAAALRALVSGKPLLAADIAGIPTGQLAALAQRLHAAKYSVIAWSSGSLDFPHADLTIQNIAELVKTLNNTTRASGLPLGGNDGETNANQVSTWISGYPMRTAFAKGFPEHDPYHFSTDSLIRSGAADALVWISSLDPDRGPPGCDLPTVVLSHPSLRLEREPDVFIPVGTPGIDHPGVAFRGDGVACLPLTKLRNSPLPALAGVLGALEAQLFKSASTC